MLIDTHCHLDFPEFQKDFVEVLSRAHSAGVEKFINPGVGIEESRKAVRLSSEYENIFAAVGIHPHESQHLNESILKELEELGKNEKVVAIGRLVSIFSKCGIQKKFKLWRLKSSSAWRKN